MPIPKSKNIELALLRVIADAGGELSAAIAITSAEVHFPLLSAEDKQVRTVSGDLKWRNRVRWARQSLMERGELDKTAPYGTWKITTTGRQRLTSDWQEWSAEYSAPPHHEPIARTVSGLSFVIRAKDRGRQGGPFSTGTVPHSQVVQSNTPSV